MSEFTHNQINDQLSNAEPQTAAVLVERENGTITTGQVFGIGEHGSKVFLGDMHSPDSRISTKLVSAEKLSDDYQGRLAHQLGSSLIKATVSIETIQSSSDDTSYLGKQTSHRANYWTTPTQEQRDNAAKFGFDLSQQDKYL